MEIKLLRITDVISKTKLSRTTIWRLEANGLFPKRIKISSRLIAWRESDIDDWINQSSKKSSEELQNEK